MLDDVGNFPFLSESGLDVQRLTDLNNSLADVGPTAWELSRLLGDPNTEADTVHAQFTSVDRILQRIHGSLDEWEPEVERVLQRTKQLKEEAVAWIMPLSILTSAICFWIACPRSASFCMLGRGG